MRKSFLYILLLFCCFIVSNPAEVQAETATASYPKDNEFYGSVTRLLQAHVAEGQVNYSKLRKNQDRLQGLVQQIAVYNLRDASDAERKAFYLNAYNILVLQQVVKHYPLKSVMDVPGFFDKEQHTVAGEKLTLNALEKQKLLTPYQDARIHFALVCAAKSCPPLLNQAYIPAQVEAQLETQAKRTLQHPQFIRVQTAGKEVLVSEIFKWYRQDFLREASSIPAYINRYRTSTLPQGYSLGYYTYNWALNDSNRQ
jgi:hypothetical protein